jgi:hypothetical protein
MSGSRAGSRGWAAALLVAAQLCALMLPAVHAHAPDVADHVEVPGTHTGHTDAACHFCRLADARFLAGARAPVVAAAPLPHDIRVAPAASVLPGAPLIASRTARGPPAS